MTVKYVSHEWHIKGLGLTLHFLIDGAPYLRFSIKKADGKHILCWWKNEETYEYVDSSVAMYIEQQVINHLKNLKDEMPKETSNLLTF